MSSRWKVQVVVAVLCLGCVARVSEARQRVRRELRFPKGGSFVAAVALASFLPKGPTDGLAHVLEFDLGFPFPDRFSIGNKEGGKRIKAKSWPKLKTKPSKRVRRRRNLKEEQKHNFLLKLEDAITRIGFNGFSCVSRLQCELRRVPPRNLLLDQLLEALFKPSSDLDDQECQKHVQTCQISLLQMMMHSKRISTPSTAQYLPPPPRRN